MEMTVVFGKIFNPITAKKCDFYEQGILVLKSVKDSEEKKIVFIGKATSKEALNFITKADKILDYSKQFIMPGFFDMHFHWVQDHVREMPKANLLEWLENYTWPFEKKFKNKAYTKSEAKRFFKRLYEAGTIGGAVYASIHEESVHQAFNEAQGEFIIGNVQMTMNSPKYLLQTEKEATELSNKLSNQYKEKYALTPRFAPTTHPEVMKACAKVAKKNKSFIQTHLSETINEIGFVLDIYSNFKEYKNIDTYTGIYKKANILGSRTIMGHGIHLSKKELEMLAGTKTAIAHCPTSNAPHKEKGLGSGLFNFKQADKFGINWALGSDIGGGPFLSMFDVMRSFIAQNKKGANEKLATAKRALFYSTQAGADILKLTKSCGNLEKGKWANFIVLAEMKTPKDLTTEELLSKIILKNQRSREKYDSMVAETFYRGIK
jgi:guanine deaminase